MADKLVAYLSDWAVNYVRNKDLLMKRLKEIVAEDDTLHAKFEHKEQELVIIPEINDLNAVLKRLSSIKDKHLTLVTLNNQAHLGLVIKHWGEFVGLGPNFNIFFVNPFSKTEKIWIIAPYIHHRISDEASLELGLRAMSELVEPITAEEANKIIT